MSPFLLVFKLRAHIVELVSNVFVIGREIADVREVGEGLLPSSTLCEPSWGFFAQKHAEEKDASGDKLEGERNHPVQVRKEDSTDANTIVDCRLEGYG